MKVSVLSANYNNVDFLDSYFYSLQNSRFKDFEIVFIDDGSSDESLKVAKNYSKKIDNLIIISLPFNVGFANALNIGLLRCRGEYIARLDPDDTVHPDRLLVQSDFLDRSPEISIIGTQAQYFLSKNNNLLNITNMPLGESDIYKAFLAPDNGVLHGTTMFRRNALGSLKYFQDEVPTEDYGFFARLLKNGCRFHNIDEPLTYVRVHESSISNEIKYETIKKMFILRKSIFSIDYFTVAVLRYYLVMYFYRKGIFQKNILYKYIYLSIASIFGIDRLFLRLKKKINVILC